MFTSLQGATTPAKISEQLKAQDPPVKINGASNVVYVQ
jgi:hypothetical protein